MLDINKISSTAVYQADWLKARSGCVTASLFGQIVGEGSEVGKFSKGAMTILEGLAGERITGIRAKEEFFTNATNHGNATEPESIDAFCEATGMSVLRNEDAGDTHRLILYDEYCCCTPDSLVLNNPKTPFNEAGTHLNVSTLECKNPLVHNQFIKLYRCLTPIDLKKTVPLYYWQVICQMLFCDVLKSYFCAYSPIFKKIRIVEFRKIELLDDIKRAKATTEYAKIEIQKIVNLLSA